MNPTPVELGTFTGLELVLISVIIGLITCAGTFFSMGKRFVTKESCALQHQSVGVEGKALTLEIGKLVANSNLQFMMLREIIVYMDLPSDIKTKILNMRPGQAD